MVTGNLPIIRVEKIEKLEDGSARVTFHYENDFLSFAAQELKIEKPTEKDISDFILTMVTNAVNKQDGWETKEVEHDPLAVELGRICYCKDCLDQADNGKF